MIARLIGAAGAGLLLSATIGAAIPSNGLSPGVNESSAIESLLLVRHSSSGGSSGSSGSHHSGAGARSSGAPAARWSAPAVRSFSGARPGWSGSAGSAGNAARWGQPRQYGRRHMPLRYLAPIFVAGAYYYPYRYLPFDGPVCTGISDNGCPMQWTEIPDEESGETSWQCVEFCQQQ